jgi:hypothetical protein
MSLGELPKTLSQSAFANDSIKAGIFVLLYKRIVLLKAFGLERSILNLA